jgi:hypothetical protein
MPRHPSTEPGANGTGGVPTFQMLEAALPGGLEPFAAVPP